MSKFWEFIIVYVYARVFLAIGLWGFSIFLDMDVKSSILVMYQGILLGIASVLVIGGSVILMFESNKYLIEVNN